MIKAVYTVTCDVCGTTHETTLVNTTKNRARGEARKAGWQWFGARDLCPTCWASLVEQSTRAPPAR